MMGGNGHGRSNSPGDHGSYPAMSLELTLISTVMNFGEQEKAQLSTELSDPALPRSHSMRLLVEITSILRLGLS